MVRRRSCARLVAVFSAFFLMLSHVHAETVGNFEIGACDSSDRCQLIGPVTGKQIGTILRSELKQANAYYEEVASADETLERRGFDQRARLLLIGSGWRLQNTDGAPSYDEDVLTVAAEVYFRRVYEQSVKLFFAKVFDFDKSEDWYLGHIGFGIALYGVTYDPRTGAKLVFRSLKRAADRYPDCYRNGTPGKDCAPLRYDLLSGCYLSADQKADLVAYPGAWTWAFQGDLAVLPGTSDKSQIDLSTAKREVSTPAPKSRSENPAGRKVCSNEQFYELR